MLKLVNIVKDYTIGDEKVHALKGVSIDFRQSEFVSVLGPSGCGKTTLLNIIGGLDKYTEGDLVIEGKSTKEFKPYDWDAYRNSKVGFVFQSYNLISHLSILGNVELALTLSGVSAAKRRQLAADALNKVGLSSQINKKPNQLSGGQMQRVAIARALVNNPEIILADEPTGALDSKTSVQILDLLKEISQDRLIIMVTHNNILAEKYSSRIISLLDGEMVSDTHPYTEEPASANASEPVSVASPDPVFEKTSQTVKDKNTAKLKAVEAKKKRKAEEREKRRIFNRTAMSFATAAKLSGKNLLAKRGRTFMTSFAGSIGIIGIALVLAISNGFNLYIDKTQSDTLSGFPISINQFAMDTSSMMTGGNNSNNGLTKFPDSDEMDIFTPDNSVYFNKNNITPEFVAHLKSMNTDYINDIQYSYGSNLMILKKVTTNGIEKIQKVATSYKSLDIMGFSQNTTVLGELLPNRVFMESQYDVLEGNYPQNKNEMVLVLDKYNRLNAGACTALGLNIDGKEKLTFGEILSEKYKVVLNDEKFVFVPAAGNTPGYYKEIDESSYTSAYTSSTVELSISGILRVKQNSPVNILSTGLYYSPSLTEYAIEDGIASEAGALQLADKIISHRKIENFSAGMPYQALSLAMTAAMGMSITPEYLYEQDLLYFSATKTPSDIYIYPKSFDDKDKVISHIQKYNKTASAANKINVTDPAEMLTSTMGTMVDIISYVLIAFAAVSLIVSSIMIGIITYVSVIERTKEIGVLRSLGARKKDISRVFNAETLIIGLAAGLIGIIMTYILSIPINLIIIAVSEGVLTTNIAVLNPLHALLLIGISMLLTFISGLIPSRMAAKKDPVIALRSEG